MARLSLWNPNKNKSNDFKFFDRTIREQFTIGGTGVIVHKFIGPENITDQNDPSQPDYDALGKINETTIQDILFLENRDRKYDPDIYELRGVYNVSDNDFDLTQFGLFLSNDILYMTFHTNAMIDIIGRKLMNGDVLELPHLIDEFALDADTPPIPKFYVVQDGNRGSEGYSPTWWSHIWRVKLGPITDSQEFDDILGATADDDSMKNLFSTFSTELNITDAIVESAAQNDPIGGATQLTDHLYNYVNSDGDNFYTGENIATGDAFPTTPNLGDYFIRTDFQPNRLFVRQDTKWIRLYDNIDDRTWSDRTFNASTFINNKDTSVGNKDVYAQRQGISKAILPRADYDAADTLGANVFGTQQDLSDVSLSLIAMLGEWTNQFTI